jgi:opacity protein-like surface antigen
MRELIIGITAVVITAAPSFAQTERGYLTGVGGFAVTPNVTSSDVLAEAGVRVAPHLMVFGDIGQFHNLQTADAQAGLDSTASTLAASQGLNVIGTGRVPATYALGGVRYEAAPQKRVSPFILGGVGVAHLKPTAQFTFSSGTLPDGSTPNVGDDVTNQLETAGDFTLAPPTTAFLFTLGGGVDVPIARHWTADAAYRFSRVATDTPLNTNGVTFGFGYRF